MGIPSELTIHMGDSDEGRKPWWSWNYFLSQLSDSAHMHTLASLYNWVTFRVSHLLGDLDVLPPCSLHGTALDKGPFGH